MSKEKKPMKYRSIFGTIEGYDNRLTTPDEALAILARAPPLIPVRERDENFQPPEKDLLNAIHYYVARRFPQKRGMFDESALLALGYLMEHWVKDLMTEETHLIYADLKGSMDIKEETDYCNRKMYKEAGRRRKMEKRESSVSVKIEDESEDDRYNLHDDIKQSYQTKRLTN